MNPVAPQTTLVILLGASTWPKTTLTGGPAFANSAYDLRDYFLDAEGFALPEANLLDLFDAPDSRDKVLERLADFLEKRIAQGRFHDLMVYYVGHGSFHGNRDDYYLALKNSRSGRERTTSLRVEDLAAEIKTHTRHIRRYVLLDCCYAGNAATIFQSSQNQRAARKTKEAFQKGTLVYCSSNKDAVSKAPLITRHTMFSGSLLHVLQHGRADFPADLTMADVNLLVKQNIEKTFDDDYAVLPELHSPDQREGDLRELPLFPNRAAAKTTISGRVIERHGKLILASREGGTLYINEERVAELEAGKFFETEPIPTGVYKVAIRNPGKPALEETITVPPGQTVERVLSSPSQALNDRVTNTRRPRPNLIAKQKPRSPWLALVAFSLKILIVIFWVIFLWKIVEKKIAKSPPSGDFIKPVIETEKAKDHGSEKVHFDPRPGEVKIFREGGLEIAMVWCPPKTFLMGSPKVEIDRRNDETQHQVTLTQGFWLAQTEVTQAQWLAVMGENPSHFKGEDLPVERVSWEDAQEFLSRLNKKLGKQVYRLPTEAEWEYACRAGTKTPFYTGENLTTEQANYDGTYPYANFKKGVYRKRTTPVKTFLPNGWGLYDMHGNVWEWCQDWRGGYATGPQVDPRGRDSGQYRVLRGGSWYDDGRYCRSAHRYGDTPGNAFGSIGFRLARGHAL